MKAACQSAVASSFLFLLALFVLCYSQHHSRCHAIHLPPAPKSQIIHYKIRTHSPTPDYSEQFDQSSDATTAQVHKPQVVYGADDFSRQKEEDCLEHHERLAGTSVGKIRHLSETRLETTSPTVHTLHSSSESPASASEASTHYPGIQSDSNQASEILPLLIPGPNSANWSSGQSLSSTNVTQHPETQGPPLQQSLQTQTHSKNPRDTLAAIILITDFQFKNGDRVASVKLVIRLMALNLFPHTPTDVYIFTLPQLVSKLKAATKGAFPSNVHVCCLDPKTWQTPEHVKNESLWHGHWGAPYRQMGDWRLSDMPKFARDKGHRYVLQTDDDSFIMSPIPFNIVQLFERNKYLISTRYIKKDTALVTWGLPELARYFLVTEIFKPSVLFKYCEPQTLDGLYSSYKSSGGMSPKYTDTFEALGLQAAGGWNRTMLNGNFVILDLDMWYTPLVQRFVSLCRSSGGSWRFRWNDQSVQAMVWQLFVPESQLFVFDFEYEHRGLPASIWKKYEKMRKQSRPAASALPVA